MKKPCEGLCDSLCAKGYCATCGLSILAINNWAQLSEEMQQVEKQAAKRKISPPIDATFYQPSVS